MNYKQSNNTRIDHTNLKISNLNILFSTVISFSILFIWALLDLAKYFQWSNGHISFYGHALSSPIWTHIQISSISSIAIIAYMDIIPWHSIIAYMDRCQHSIAYMDKCKKDHNKHHQSLDPRAYPNKVSTSRLSLSNYYISHIIISNQSCLPTYFYNLKQKNLFLSITT